MKHSIQKLKHFKVDCLYGKKKHFNAADRLENIHYQIGIPLIVVNVVTGSVVFFVVTDGITNWVRFIPLVLALIAALLSTFQTYLNLPLKVDGHRRIGNKYLSCMKKCDLIHGMLLDDLLTPDSFVQRLESLQSDIASINSESEAFPTSKSDYRLAKKSIEKGDENYNETELNL